MNLLIVHVFPHYPHVSSMCPLAIHVAHCVTHCPMCLLNVRVSPLCRSAPSLSMCLLVVVPKKLQGLFLLPMADVRVSPVLVPVLLWLLRICHDRPVVLGLLQPAFLIAATARHRGTGQGCASPCAAGSASTLPEQEGHRGVGFCHTSSPSPHAPLQENVFWGQVFLC